MRCVAGVWGRVQRGISHGRMDCHWFASRGSQKTRTTGMPEANWRCTGRATGGSIYLRLAHIYTGDSLLSGSISPSPSLPYLIDLPLAFETARVDVTWLQDVLRKDPSHLRPLACETGAPALAGKKPRHPRTALHHSARETCANKCNAVHRNM